MSNWINVKDNLPRNDSFVVGASFDNLHCPDIAVFWFNRGEFILRCHGIKTEDNVHVLMVSEFEPTHFVQLQDYPGDYFYG